MLIRLSAAMAGTWVLLALGGLGGIGEARAAESASNSRVRAELDTLAVEVERLEGARAIKNPPPDRRPSGVYLTYPSPYIVPFHFPNPLTGVPLKEPVP